MKRNVLTGILVIAGMFALAGCNKTATPPDATGPSATSSIAPAAPGNAVTAEGPSATGQVPVQAMTPGAPAPMPPSAPPPAPNPIVIRSGKTIEITVDQSISSKTSNPGDHFDASLAAPVIVNGQQVIPSGARVVGTVTDAKSAGKFHGNAALTVTLDSVRVHGQRYSLRTTSVTEAGKGRGKRTGIGAGGGAVVGGIIGALAGGGKGAAIGAGAGAGAGAAGAGFTGDRDIMIGAETRLQFRLRAPLEIAGN